MGNSKKPDPEKEENENDLTEAPLQLPSKEDEFDENAQVRDQNDN